MENIELKGSCKIENEKFTAVKWKLLDFYAI